MPDHDPISPNPTQRAAPTPELPAPRCPECGAVLGGAESYAAFHICPACGHHLPESARACIARLVDPGSFKEHDSELVSSDPLRFEDETAYRDRLRDLRDKTGERDALVTGFARIDGVQVAVAALDFSFLGGSMGVVVGEKLARLVEQARERKAPLITVSASGGARMQEGMLSLLQMAKTSAAVQRLHDSGVPYISILRNPTTGGVFASFANLGDVTLAEPGALIGFAGPRVAEQVIGAKLPPGSHSAEFLLEHGMIDAIVARPEQRAYLANLLSVLTAPRKGHERRPRRLRKENPAGNVVAWEAVQRARATDRLTSADYLRLMLDRFVELHGDRSSGDDPAIVAGVGMLRGHAVAVIAMERGHGEDRTRRHEGRPYPEGYRKARRTMDLAERLELPLLTLIDTPGAYPGIESEERGLAAEIAASLARMSNLRTPVVSAVIGEGGSGGALALAVADRVLMFEGAIYSVIAPEGAAAILYRDVERAPEVSSKLKLTAHELRELGIVDEVISEPIAGTPEALAESLAAAISDALAQLQRKKVERVVKERYERYQRVGRSYARAPRRLKILRRRSAETRAG
ncbi:MAG: acetyl-CoA carboxylase, carboxyltransferase subunit beta [Thermomicrobiales bacterium]|nr:acetyl-CoA carboxylase, carboxyltransferase subunit beta [Thermomicrobiales bacterium]